MDEAKQDGARACGDEIGAVVGGFLEAFLKTPFILMEKGKAETRKAYQEATRAELENEHLLSGTKAETPKLETAQAIADPQIAQEEFRKGFEEEVIPVLELLRIRYDYVSVELVDGRPVFTMGFNSVVMEPASPNTPEKAATDGEAE